MSRSSHQSSGPLLFWMDTLCIPVRPEDTSLCLTQINNMASIFKGVTSSLVLDAELMTTSINTKPLFPKSTHVTDHGRISLSTKVRAQIACSVWMPRCWTFQEGQLPPLLAIAFINSMVVLGRIDGSYSERLFVYGASGQPIITRQDGVEAILIEATNVYEVRQINRGSSLVCECVDIALQESLYTTFFLTKDYEFVTAWNELSGRSTTKPHDIPSIIANVMDLSNRPLLEYHTTHEMFQVIILSFPISIFFNTGPRHDQDCDHKNRWIPRGVGANLLSAKPWMKVHRSHLSYRYHPKENELLVYSLDRVVSLKSQVYFRCNTSGTTYVVGPSMSIKDEMNIDLYSATMILIENAKSRMKKGQYRGALFYLQNPKATSLEWLGWCQTKPELTYVRPLHLEKVKTTDLMPEGAAQFHIIKLVTAACELTIKYDPLPKFKPLTRRRWLKQFGSLAVFILGVIYVLIWAVGFYIRLSRQVGTVSAFLAASGVCLALLFVGFTIKRYLKRWLNWRYIQSFEVIANRESVKTGV
ncbi:hypothetical protein F5B22DRAFT_582065 [Xylaria bambusicola]|uniref:uncharacterized protein n=1 Tax=Xylaria bambusicola TaxID=326684 RepID=UPI0020080CBC|nr:uncharacterized protein F5B22DRAFT_582065 [Xylaria bambusicola]KAI0527724.1 hypothetical protein F5B22DRAFT_582065 [Xylaria bambusicola]